jgi:outer membrane protein TolC
MPLVGLACSSPSLTATPSVARAANPEGDKPAGEVQARSQTAVQSLPDPRNEQPVQTGQAQAEPVAENPPVQTGQAQAEPVVEKLPVPEEQAPAKQEPAKPDAHKPVPVSLDTVLRLAQDQNSQINIARERVVEAFAESDVAAKQWLPDLYIGTSYYRHEGAIQQEDGSVIHSSFGSLFGGVEISSQFDIREYAFHKVNAERKTWQQRAELSRITSDNLVDAANAYIDLLASYQGAAVIRSTDDEMDQLLKMTKDLADPKIAPAYQAEVHRIQAEIANRKEMILRLRQQGDAAKAKLAYLLGLSPDCCLVPVDNRLGILHLADATIPTCDLVAQALTTGPGIREMQGLLNLIQQSIEKAKGPSKYMPIIGLRMAEGIFGGGPGDSSDWDNRWDMVLQARWNLTELCTARDRARVSQARYNQAQLSYQDLRGKLSAGVEEAQSAILSGQQQLRQGEEQIKQAKEAVRLSMERYKEIAQGRSPSDPLLAIRSQTGAQLSYLGAIRDFDKAQIRLLILTGQVTDGGDGHCHGH